jgi:hypothetical protein
MCGCCSSSLVRTALKLWRTWKRGSLSGLARYGNRNHSRQSAASEELLLLLLLLLMSWGPYSLKKSAMASCRPALCAVTRNRRSRSASTADTRRS